MFNYKKYIERIQKILKSNLKDFPKYVISIFNYLNRKYLKAYHFLRNKYFV